MSQSAPARKGGTISQHDDITLLSRLPGFAELARRDLEVFLAHAHPVSFDAGVAFIEQGQAADCAFLLLAGSCRAEVQREGAVEVVGRIRPGAIVGEVGLYCTGTKRGATVRAEEPVRLLLLTRDLLDAPAARPVVRRLERRTLGDVAERVRRTSSTRARLARQADAARSTPPPSDEGGGFLARLRDRWKR